MTRKKILCGLITTLVHNKWLHQFELLKGILLNKRRISLHSPNHFISRQIKPIGIILFVHFTKLRPLSRDILFSSLTLVDKTLDIVFAGEPINRL